MFDSQHRKVNPARESVGSDLYTVLLFDPITQTCDIAPASINQRGILSKVPIACAFGGAWENQIFHEPRLTEIVSDRWGDASRGARWGLSFPVQQGDLCRVMYIGESMSDPVITEFLYGNGSYGIPWVANQILGDRGNKYTESTPQDDAETGDRFDLLLPSGAWLRSTLLSSWVLATAPVQLPMAWISIGADGKIKIKARQQSEEDYSTSFEIDPESANMRSVCGGSSLEFKDGDITIKAEKRIKVFAERFEVELANQVDGLLRSALEPLMELPDDIPDESLIDLATTAAGDLILSGVSPLQAAASLFEKSATELGTTIRNRIQDLSISPSPIVMEVVMGFTEGMDESAIVEQLKKLLGARSLVGTIEEFATRLNIGKLAKSLDIPSWIAEAIGESIVEPIQSVLNMAGKNSLRSKLAELCRHAGCLILDGFEPEEAREQILKDLGDEQIRLDSIAALPLPSVSSNSDVMGLAKRIGKYVLQGEDDLAGSAKLFHVDDFVFLRIGDDAIAAINKQAKQLERLFVQPKVEELEKIAKSLSIADLSTLGTLPAEVREAIGRLPSRFIAIIPDLLKSPDAIGAIVDEGLNQLGSLLKQLPDDLQELVLNFPASILKSLAELADSIDITQIMADPQAAIDQIISGLPGLGDLLKIGVFRVRSIRPTPLAKPNPAIAKRLAEWTKAHPNVTTEATPITRVAEYGLLELPDYWSNDFATNS